MKNITLQIILLFAIAFCACNKHTYTPTGSLTAVTIEKDCTGTYLRLNGKDYHVCNTERTTSFKSGTEVISDFHRISECTGTAHNAIVCMMLHQNEGWVEISTIAIK